MASVKIYTSGTCPYCNMAKRLLQEKGINTWEEIRIDNIQNGREEMINITGRRTVPQIFIGETHVGGFDDLNALNRNGKLDALLTL
ncbi:MAG: glutaredoxin 3 [Neisseriaceae bacterium]|nr:glutaredoxin 3 [Neisseriaceae bacterium]